MTIEIFNFLKEYENLLYTASERNYVMFGSYEVKKKMAAIYEDVFHKKSNILNSCSTCSLREMKELAKEYYDFKKRMKLQENKTKNKSKKN